jgi:hypothetical protein
VVSEAALDGLVARAVTRAEHARLDRPARASADQAERDA